MSKNISKSPKKSKTKRFRRTHDEILKGLTIDECILERERVKQEEMMKDAFQINENLIKEQEVQ